MPPSLLFKDEVVLVDENDTMIGVESKLKAHQNGGQLHRAFSIFIFNSKREMLLQQRAHSKYHFGGLWSNACCSHPYTGETLPVIAEARLQHEMGFTTPLSPLFTFLYRASDEASGLTEHEFDHVLYGEFDGAPQPNPEEVGDWKWISFSDLLDDMKAQPEIYTPWFCIAIPQLREQLDLSF